MFSIICYDHAGRKLKLIVGRGEVELCLGELRSRIEDLWPAFWGGEG
jgi:hypothetical protein